MNYEKLKALAALLDKQHGEPDRHGFIVAPHSEAQLNEHKHALVHRDSIFHYHPVSDERLGILSVTREEIIHDDQSRKIDYPHIRLEHIPFDTLVTPEIEPLLTEYMEFARSRRD